MTYKKMKQLSRRDKPNEVSDRLGDAIAKNIRKAVEKNKLCGSCKK